MKRERSLGSLAHRPHTVQDQGVSESTPRCTWPPGARASGEQPGGNRAAAIQHHRQPLLLVALLAGAIWWTVTTDPSAEWVFLAGTLAAWALFLPAALLARPIPARHAAAVVLLGSLLLGAVALSAPPATSNDSARYAWDGIIQKAGISPYRYVPADQALRPLRGSMRLGLFPRPSVKTR